jgi:hypothetical protein
MSYDEYGNRITLPGEQGPYFSAGVLDLPESEQVSEPEQGPYFSAGVLDPPDSEQASEPEQEPHPPSAAPTMTPTMAPPMARKKQKVERSAAQTELQGLYTCTECKGPKPGARSNCQNTMCGKYRETKTRRTRPGPPRQPRCKLIIDKGGGMARVCGKTKTHSRTRCDCDGVKETEWREKNPVGEIREDQTIPTDDTQLNQPFEGAQLKSKYKKKKKTKKKKKQKKTKQRFRKTK